MATRKILTDRRFTWNEYLARVKARPTGSSWGETSQKTEYNDSGWTGTQNFADAIKLAEKGWPVGTAQMLEGLEHAPQGDVPSLFPAQDYDVAGEYPDVAAYCAGIPEHMVTLGEQRTRAVPIVRLGVNGGASASTNLEDIVRYGVAVLSHVVAYQRAGYSVALDWLKVSAQSGPSSKQLHLTRVEILATGGVLDIDRLAFMLAHPAMLRRCWFADVEQEPKMRGIRAQYGYARPIAEAGPGWYDGIALPGVMECPSYEILGDVSRIAEWLGGVIDKAQDGYAQAA